MPEVGVEDLIWALMSLASGRCVIIEVCCCRDCLWLEVLRELGSCSEGSSFLYDYCCHSLSTSIL